MNTATKYSNRYIAQIDIEAVTPLAIGSGEKSILTDSLVIKDINGLPYIPGTSLAGVIRSAVDELDKDELFGFQDGNDGKGSKLIFSDGRMIGKNGQAIDGIYQFGLDDTSDKFLEKFITLPVRQHVRISANGATEKGGKFDEQIVFKGTRFRFEIELRSESDQEKAFLKILDVMSKSDFRIGSGSRSGLGRIEVVTCTWKSFDLSKKEERESYLSKTSSLEDVLEGNKYETNGGKNGTIEYKLLLKPVDFLLIGSGIGDEDADMTPVTESYITWSNGRPKFETANIVLPASSLKGALAHRTAFHFNSSEAEKKYLDTLDIDSLASVIGDSNAAVEGLFGNATGKIIKRGKVLFDDIIVYSDKARPFILSHASIDRFTGGAKDGALYQEKVLFSKDEILETSIILTDVKNVKNEYISAFEKALKDLCDGLLPLGGGAGRGNGCFKGEIYKDGELI